MTDQPQPAHVPATFAEHQKTASAKQLTTKRIVFDPAGEPSWTHLSNNGGDEEPLRYRTGKRVSFYLDGAARNGTIDAVMPDGTLLWVWLDDGAGRRLLSSDEPTLMLHPARTASPTVAALPVDIEKPDTSTQR
ncbi:hypothetical protein DM793_01845 [Paenarthrobacter nitroguajacolicus]|uniref:hypothetical protein n=1 Tax=Paenarthrobacter nitroguajacolicus TaxID=211146 RepID=UPI0015BF15D7|nr:hypothetical protein [Paenarthrobacter nitroguajacolicus]NWL10044.1 hypothetical protein [Paenarthrobacter nitroguajacolicus]